jgi:hypothetical protein
VNNYKADVWFKELTTGKKRELTVEGNTSLFKSYYRLARSPNGQWLTFSSAYNIQWRGHGNGTGWKHTQKLSIYVIRPDGTDFIELATKTKYCLGSPDFSPMASA